MRVLLIALLAAISYAQTGKIPLSQVTNGSGGRLCPISHVHFALLKKVVIIKEDIPRVAEMLEVEVISDTGLDVWIAQHGPMFRDPLGRLNTRNLTRIDYELYEIQNFVRKISLDSLTNGSGGTTCPQTGEEFLVGRIVYVLKKDMGRVNGGDIVVAISQAGMEEYLREKYKFWKYAKDPPLSATFKFKDPLEREAGKLFELKEYDIFQIGPHSHDPNPPLPVRQPEQAPPNWPPPHPQVSVNSSLSASQKSWILFGLMLLLLLLCRIIYKVFQTFHIKRTYLLPLAKI